MTTHRMPAFKLLGGSYVEAASAVDAARQANLDWQVSLAPVYADVTVGYTSGGGAITNPLKVDDKWATIKTTTDGTPSVLGVVGNRYGVLQNEEMFSALDGIVDSADARYTAAGELEGGKQVYMVMEMGDGVKIDGDPHASYLLARTSHDGSTALQITTVINRLSCTNQLNASFLRAKRNGQGIYTLRHTSNAKVKTQDVREALRLVYEDMEWYEGMSNLLLSKSFSDTEAKNFYEKLWPIEPKVANTPYDSLTQGEKRAKTIALTARKVSFDIYKNATNTQANLQNTQFGAFQAVVEWADWFSSNDDELRASRVMSGSADTIKSKALTLLGVTA